MKIFSWSIFSCICRLFLPYQLSRKNPCVNLVQITKANCKTPMKEIDKKQPPEVVCNLHRPVTLLRCFPMKFAKFLRIPILKKSLLNCMPCVLKTYSRVIVPCALTWWQCVCVLTCSRANLPWVLLDSRVDKAYELTCEYVLSSLPLPACVARHHLATYMAYLALSTIKALLPLPLKLHTLLVWLI